ncbi:MAG: M48 family metalloprotease [Gammaproteobacteria bacterium]|nr:M48 family metalloprotease [Gammaproteobacteria bacterium]
MFRSIISVLITLLFVASCNEAHLQTAMNTSVGLLQAQALSESQVIQKASLASTELDSQSQIAPSDSNYTRRLNRLINGLTSYEGLSLNYKVYLTDSVNAFAMANGTIRVHSALMDIMPDDQVLAVIAHEVGHVKLKHSYKQMRKAILTNTAFQAAASTEGTIGDMTRSQLGQLEQPLQAQKVS